MKKDDRFECLGQQHLSTPSMASASTVGLLAAIAIPNFVRARAVAQKNACINNLRQLDGAKQQWAREDHKPTGTEVTMTELVPFLPKPPECPAGGVYRVGEVGKRPTCSIEGHEL
jgi:hypothetical protein